jgi:hypothetical protein
MARFMGRYEMTHPVKMMLAAGLLAMGVTVHSTVTAEALTVVQSGDSLTINGAETYKGTVGPATGGFQSWYVAFSSLEDGVSINARVTLTSAMKDMFTILKVYWVNPTNLETLAFTRIGSGQTDLATVFTSRNSTQWLVFDWQDATSGAEFTVDIGGVAAVPLPMGGLLLVGGLAGLVALRQTKNSRKMRLT